MLAHITLATFYYVVGAVGAVLALVLLSGLLAGQFRKGVVEELRASLRTAETEVNLYKSIVERLEKSVDLLNERVLHLQRENDTLRALISGPDAPQLQKLMERFDRLEKLVDRNHEEKPDARPE